jgi:predicted nucleic acid-binding protein
MTRQNLVLADTSVWIRYLRDVRAEESKIMHELIAADRIVICGPVLAEILSGSLNRSAYTTIKELMSAIPCLEPSSGAWEKIGEARFILSRKGVQSSLIDLWIAAVAHEYGVAVWTLDKDFERILPAIPFEPFQI